MFERKQLYTLHNAMYVFMYYQKIKNNLPKTKLDRRASRYSSSVYTCKASSADPRRWEKYRSYPENSYSYSN